MCGPGNSVDETTRRPSRMAPTATASTWAASAGPRAATALRRFQERLRPRRTAWPRRRCSTRPSSRPSARGHRVVWTITTMPNRPARSRPRFRLGSVCSCCAIAEQPATWRFPVSSAPSQGRLHASTDQECRLRDQTDALLAERGDPQWPPNWSSPYLAAAIHGLRAAGDQPGHPDRRRTGQPARLPGAHHGSVAWNEFDADGVPPIRCRSSSARPNSLEVPAGESGKPRKAGDYRDFLERGEAFAAYLKPGVPGYPLPAALLRADPTGMDLIGILGWRDAPSGWSRWHLITSASVSFLHNKAPNCRSQHPGANEMLRLMPWGLARDRKQANEPPILNDYLRHGLAEMVQAFDEQRRPATRSVYHNEYRDPMS